MTLPQSVMQISKMSQRLANWPSTANLADAVKPAQ